MRAASRSSWRGVVCKACLAATVLRLAFSGLLLAEEPQPPRTGLLTRQSGTREQVALLSLTSTSSLWQAPDRQPAVAVDDLLAWGRCPAEGIAPRLRLQDGSVLAGTLKAWTEATVTLDSPLFGRVALPAAAVRSWETTAATAPSPSWAETGPHTLRLELTNGDRLTVRSLTLAAGSTVAEVQPAAGESEPPAGAAIRIPRGRIEAIRMPAVPAADLATARHRTNALLGFFDGSRLAVEQVLPVESSTTSPADRSDDVRLWPAALRGQPEPSLRCLRVAITGLLATAAPVVPLQWLTPSSYQQTPQLGPAWPLTTGTTVTGLPLTARGRPAFTGLGLHATAGVAYELPAGTVAERLLTDVAVDDSAGQGGSAVIRIRAGAGPHAAADVFVSDILRGGEPLLTIDLPLDQARWLELSVEPTDDGDMLDRTVWLEPRLVTRQTSQSGQHAPSPAASGALQETSPGPR